MPTSKETRVRVEDFEKISAQVWPANGFGADFWPRDRFNSRASANSAGNSDALKSVSLRKCFIEAKMSRLPPSAARVKKHRLPPTRPVTGASQFEQVADDKPWSSDVG